MSGTEEGFSGALQNILAAGFLHQNGTPFTEGENALTADFGERNLRFLFEQTEDGISRVLDISEV